MLNNISGTKKSHTPESILNYICKTEDITQEEITSASRTRKIARTRQKIIYILRKHTGISYIQIAKMLGNKDHSSIIYAETQAKKLIRTMPEFAADIANAEKQLNLNS